MHGGKRRRKGRRERKRAATGISLHVSTVILSIVYRLEIFTAKAFFNTAAHTAHSTPCTDGYLRGNPGVKIRNATLEINQQCRARKGILLRDRGGS